MEEIGLETLWLTIGICLIVGLLIGYLVGRFAGSGKSKAKAATEQAVKTHENYRDEVHEHFEQTSQIMSRMVDDYREMYKHVSDGAGKLANIYPEHVVTPPPAPEAITDKNTGDAPDARTDERATAKEAPAESEPSRAAGAVDAGTGQAGEDEKARARRLSGNPT